MSSSSSRRFGVQTRAVTIFALALSLAFLTPAAFAEGTGIKLPAGTLIYKIVYTGHAVTRSAKQNASAGYGNLLDVIPGSVPANRVSIHQVVTGTMRMKGFSLPSDPIASAAERKTQQAEENKKMQQAQQPMASMAKALAKAQKACHGNIQCIMAANKRVMSQMSSQQKAAMATGEPAKKIMHAQKKVLHRFSVWRQSEPCRRKVVSTGKASGISFAFDSGYSQAIRYRANLSATKQIGCTRPGKGGGNLNAYDTVLVFDSGNGTWEMRIAALEFSGKLPYSYFQASSDPTNKISRDHGKAKTAYTLSAPAIVLRGLRGAAPTHTIRGKKTLKVDLTFAALDTFNDPVEAVITWKFTPDKE